MKPAPFFKAITVAFVFMISFSLRAVSGDEHWDNQFGWPGPGGNNYAIVTHNGQIYSGGLGTATNTTLQFWDGFQWSPFAQCQGSNSTIIYDLAFVGNTLYVGGVFTNVGGVTASGLAKWDGTSWSSVNFSGVVLGLTVNGGNLYVSGIFTNPAANGMIATNVAYWDGVNWYALGNGLGKPNTSSVRVTAINNGLVYAGGSFTNSGVQSVTNIAVWDGNTWTQVGVGVNGIVASAVFDGSDLYVAGTFSQAGSTPANLVAKWDGVNWSALGAGLSGIVVYSIAPLNGSLFAIGTFTSTTGIHATNFAVWNGSTWSPVGVGISTISGMARVCATESNVLVGANFVAAGGIIANGLAACDGVNWSSIGTPGRINGVGSTVRCIAGEPNNLYIGGTFNQEGQTNGRVVAHFDGTNWNPMGDSLSGGNNFIVNTMASTGSNVYVGGSFSFAGSVPAANIAAWDGTNWSALGSGPGGVVAAIAVRPEGIYAAGAPQGVSLYGSPFFMRYDGATWQNVLNFNTNDTFFALYFNDSNIGMDAIAVQDTNIYVGGHLSITWHDPTLTLATNCMNILRFDGTYARIVGTGLNSNVVAMAVVGTNLYVAGLFTNAGGVTANHIARWDGNVWSDVGGSVVGSGNVNTLTAIGTNLFAAGSFTNMGGVPVTRIAKWDGNVWSALGSGVSAAVTTLYATGSNVYAGGGFRIAGGKASQFLGRWNDQLNFNTPRLANSVWPGAGQFKARVYGASGVTNVVEASSDFNSWTPIATNSVGIFDFIDSGAGSYRERFYRAKVAQ